MSLPVNVLVRVAERVLDGPPSEDSYSKSISRADANLIDQGLDRKVTSWGANMTDVYETPACCIKRALSVQKMTYMFSTEPAALTAEIMDALDADSLLRTMISCSKTRFDNTKHEYIVDRARLDASRAVEEGAGRSGGGSACLCLMRAFDYAVSHENVRVLQALLEAAGDCPILMRYMHGSTYYVSDLRVFASECARLRDKSSGLQMLVIEHGMQRPMGDDGRKKMKFCLEEQVYSTAYYMNSDRMRFVLALYPPVPASSSSSPYQKQLHPPRPVHRVSFLRGSGFDRSERVFRTPERAGPRNRSLRRRGTVGGQPGICGRCSDRRKRPSRGWRPFRTRRTCIRANALHLSLPQSCRGSPRRAALDPPLTGRSVHRTRGGAGTLSSPDSASAVGVC